MPTSLMTIPPEILSLMMKQLSFSDLEVLIGTNKRSKEVYENNYYSIYGAIARRELGELYKYAYQLPIEHSKLYRIANIKVDIRKVFFTDEEKEEYIEESGGGVLEGGKLIGKTEANILMGYKKALDGYRPTLVRHCLLSKGHSAIGASRGGFRVQAIHFEGDTLTTEEEFHINRAILRFWTLLLACIPDSIMWVATCKHASCSRGPNGFEHSMPY